MARYSILRRLSWCGVSGTKQTA